MRVLFAGRGRPTGLMRATTSRVADDVRDWGHVGLTLGDGRMVHAWGTVRVDKIAEIADLPGAEGWTAPSYVGWTAPRRIVKGAVERSWDGL